MQEARGSGIPVLPPDINRSGADFRVETTPEGKQAIRFALAAVKRVGEAAMRDLVRGARRRRALRARWPTSPTRVDPKLLNKMQIENLARAGAFDCLEKNRARLMAGAETILRRAQASRRGARLSGQIGAVRRRMPQRASRCACPTCRTGRCSRRLAHEAEAVGFHLSAHPLDTYRKALAAAGRDAIGADRRPRARPARRG